MASQKRLTHSPSPRPMPKPDLQPQKVPLSPQKFSTKKASQRLDSIQTDGLLTSLKKNRQDLCTCFDIFELLFQNNVPQRCLQHNNFLTLYCEDQQKLLCVNCIYGSSQHRLHRVIPIKNAMEQVVEDNRLMEQKLQKMIEAIKATQKAAIDSASEGQHQLNLFLKNLDQEFEKLRQLINDKYITSKKAIISIFQESATKNEQLMDEIRWLKTTYSEREKAIPRSGEQSALIFNHLMLNTLLNSEKLQPKLIKQLNFEQMRYEHIGEISRIREMIETGKVRQKTRMF